ncbi:hypothetical protein BDDG_03730 [Blastomyces dermatitidis ATCC 18188]|uniref:Uncharacterized protein n=1 Tax=Ajellomyces dermatitidis (strain ATCC 18188 / CBS 674.68) TaxID=653446 RepID=F2TC26_AJEDA|nr:hypothetical protein BDDG_03730 [Blastomyces dermatitidis ATCC 18188]
MALSIKHQLQRWTVQQLHRIGFTKVTLSTPLPTRGDGSTFDMDDDDYDARSAQLREHHGHPRTHSHAEIYEGSTACDHTTDTSFSTATRRRGIRVFRFLRIRGSRGLVSLLVVFAVVLAFWKGGWFWSGSRLGKTSRLGEGNKS